MTDRETLEARLADLKRKLAAGVATSEEGLRGRTCPNCALPVTWSGVGDSP